MAATGITGTSEGTLAWILGERKRKAGLTGIAITIEGDG
jgi:hypothetical protein